MKAGGPVQAHPLLAPGVGLITTLLALMSAAWILMTLEVAFVVRPLPLRLQPRLPPPLPPRLPQCIAPSTARRQRVASRGAYTS